jgi:hypothetical protein
MHAEGAMTAHRPAKTAPGRTVTRKQDPVPEPGRWGWPDVIRYAIEDWRRTALLCVIVVVVGAVLLLAMRLGFRFWL